MNMPSENFVHGQLLYIVELCKIEMITKLFRIEL